MKHRKKICHKIKFHKHCENLNRITSLRCIKALQMTSYHFLFKYLKRGKKGNKNTATLRQRGGGRFDFLSRQQIIPTDSRLSLLLCISMT